MIPAPAGISPETFIVTSAGSAGGTVRYDLLFDGKRQVDYRATVLARGDANVRSDGRVHQVGGFGEGATPQIGQAGSVFAVVGASEDTAFLKATPDLGPAGKPNRPNGWVSEVSDGLSPFFYVPLTPFFPPQIHLLETGVVGGIPHVSSVQDGEFRLFYGRSTWSHNAVYADNTRNFGQHVGEFPNLHLAFPLAVNGQPLLWVDMSVEPGDLPDARFLVELAPPVRTALSRRRLSFDL